MGSQFVRRRLKGRAGRSLRTRRTSRGIALTAAAYSNAMRTISGFVPRRIGGPHVPAPHDV
jgi:hypothetical protein